MALNAMQQERTGKRDWMTCVMCTRLFYTTQRVGLDSRKFDSSLITKTPNMSMHHGVFVCSIHYSILLRRIYTAQNLFLFFIKYKSSKTCYGRLPCVSTD